MRSRVLGVAFDNTRDRTLADYEDLRAAPDIKYKPQINEYEMNPFLLSDPKLRDLSSYEMKHGIVHMSELGPMTIKLHAIADHERRLRLLVYSIRQAAT